MAGHHVGQARGLSTGVDRARGNAWVVDRFTRVPGCVQGSALADCFGAASAGPLPTRTPTTPHESPAINLPATKAPRPDG